MLRWLARSLLDPWAMPRLATILLALLLVPQLCWAAPDRPQARGRALAKKSLAGPPRGKAPAGSLLGWGRAPNPAHPLRRLLGPEALLQAVLDLADSKDLHRQPRHLRRALSHLAQLPQRRLVQQKTQLKLLKLLKHKLGDERFTTLIGTRAAGVKWAAELLDSTPTRADAADMQRGWGWKLLPRNDKAFRDPRYLIDLLRESGQSGTGHYIDDEPTQALEQFKAAWAKIAPANTEPMTFTLAGSDANNALYDLAAEVVGSERGKNGAELLVFRGSFGGGRGKIAKIGYLGWPESGPLKDYLITSPTTSEFHPSDPAEVHRLEQLEAQALAEIEQKVKSSDRPVGGLLIEPIQGIKGVLVYRPEFMTKLRALCDKLKLPIIADEILTGGGRTGKFFAYQHYEGFEPDLITFGKGLQVSGIAYVKRKGGRRLVYRPEEMTTLKAYAEPLLKGAQVMNRIRLDGLMENASEVGSYLLQRLRERELGTSLSKSDQRSRGVGLLLHSNCFLPGISNAKNRLMPYLSLSKADVDRLLGSPRKQLDQLALSIDEARTDWIKGSSSSPQQYRKARTSLDLALAQAEGLGRATYASPRLKRRAAQVAASARAALAEIVPAYAEQILPELEKSKALTRGTLARMCSLLNESRVSLPPSLSSRLQRTALRALASAVKDSLLQVKAEMKRKNYQSAAYNMGSLISLVELAGSDHESYLAWARALPEKDPVAWAALQKKLAPFKPKVQRLFTKVNEQLTRCGMRPLSR